MKYAAVALLVALGCRASLPPPELPLTRTLSSVDYATRPPPLSAAPDGPAVPVVEHTLANGFRVFVVERPGLPLVTIAYVNRDAREHEFGRPAGIATITANMLLEGTALDNGETLENMRIAGRAPWARTVRDGTFVGLTIAERGYPTAIAMLARVVTTPALATVHLQRAREAFLASLDHTRHTTAGYARIVAFENLFGADHPWAWLYERYALDAFTLDRQRIALYHHQLYVPHRSALILMGAVTASTAIAIADRHFGTWKSTVPDRGSWERTKFEFTKQGEPTVHTLAAADIEATAYAAIPAPKFGDPDMHAMEILAHVLGGSMISRAQSNLRHGRGVAYAANAVYQPFTDAGYVELATSTANEAIVDAVVALRAELSRARTGGVLAAELRAAKASYRRDLALEAPDTSIEFVGRAFCAGLDADWIADARKAVEAVTVEDVARVAKKYVPAKADFVIIGNGRKYGDVSPLGKIRNRTPLFTIGIR